MQLQRVQAVTLYDGMAKRLLWQLKSDGTQVAAKTMAYGMSGLLEGNKECLLVPIPTASARIRSRGYDQARLLVGHVSRRSGIPWAACLARHGQAHQVGAGRATRLKQLKTAFRGRLPWLVKGAHIVLIDDVVTTGASFEAAAEVLYGMGAASVEGLAFAQVAASKQKAP